MFVMRKLSKYILSQIVCESCYKYNTINQIAYGLYFLNEYEYAFVYKNYVYNTHRTHLYAYDRINVNDEIYRIWFEKEPVDIESIRINLNLYQIDSIKDNYSSYILVNKIRMIRKKVYFTTEKECYGLLYTYFIHHHYNSDWEYIKTIIFNGYNVNKTYDIIYTPEKIELSIIHNNLQEKYVYIKQVK